MQLKALRTYFQNALLGYYLDTEIQTFFKILCDKGLGYKPVDIVLKAEETIDGKSYHFFEEAINRLQNYEPIQYVLGETEFYGLKFKVNKSVLIPRPETEELVDWIVKDHKNKAFKILDIGTGSGCIPIALAKHLPQASVFALDVSKEALQLAKQNADANKATVNYIEADILTINPKKFFAEYGKFDIIVSNPPYVRSSEKVLMKENVVNYEPHLALFVEDDDPLIFYKQIVAVSEQLLKPEGTLYFEINEGLGAETVKVMEPDFNNIELRKDMLGKDRMIKGIKK